jgi:MoaA/NifB/PqqE/SkfB family radical SAM enzyme
MAREAVYLKTGIDITAPETIHGIVTERCNYKCHYCSCWQLDRYDEEMSIGEWQQALLSLKAFIGRYIIQFSGGEPFVKKGFIDLLHFCHEQDLGWGVITNGSALTQKIVEGIVAARPCNIDISVDSSDAAAHDFVRGAAGSLEAVGSGIQRLRAERDRTGYRFPIRLKPTITRLSYRTLPRLVAWATEHGADTVDFAPVRPIVETFWTPQIDAELWIRGHEIEELRHVVATLVQMKEAGAPIETPSEKLRTLPDHFLRHPVNTGLAPCRVGMRDFHIRPNGAVWVCWEYPSIGSVRTQSAREVWTGAKAQAIRAQTVACSKFASISCANSCLDHRTLLQDIKLTTLMLKRKLL